MPLSGATEPAVPGDCPVSLARPDWGSGDSWGSGLSLSCLPEASSLMAGDRRRPWGGLDGSCPAAPLSCGGSERRGFPAPGFSPPSRRWGTSPGPSAQKKGWDWVRRTRERAVTQGCSRGKHEGGPFLPRPLTREGRQDSCAHVNPGAENKGHLIAANPIAEGDERPSVRFLEARLRPACGRPPTRVKIARGACHRCEFLQGWQVAGLSSSGHCAQKTGGLNPPKRPFSQFWRPELLDQAVSRATLPLKRVDEVRPAPRGCWQSWHAVARGCVPPAPHRSPRLSSHGVSLRVCAQTSLCLEGRQPLD